MKVRDIILKHTICLIAMLPFRIIYILSDVAFFIIYHIIKYRREIVYKNISESFPEKDKNEIKQIVKKFYQNLSDFQFELIKSCNMTKKQVNERVVFKNHEIFDELYHNNKNIIVALGHCGNWEWTGNKMAMFLKHEGAAVYKPLEDKFFDDYMISIRRKYKNTLMIDYKKTLRTLLSLSDKLYSVFMLADQSPARTEINYWKEFLGRETPFYMGMEKIARALNYAVVYLDIQREKRGFYEVEVKIICREGATTKSMEIMNSYISYLEDSIRKNPDNWLWSHRRWKYTKEQIAS
jgi:KDO2-lipid IV(A) lauroyltransferase